MPTVIVRLFVCLAIVCTASSRAAAPPASPQHEGNVARATFTTQVENREPVNPQSLFSPQVGEVFLFTELSNLAGHSVTHRWEYQDQVMAEVSFEVRGPRWRVWSRKTILPHQLGKWTVVVVDEAGWPLHAGIFEVTEAAAGQ